MKPLFILKNVIIVLTPLIVYYGFLYCVYFLSMKGVTTATPPDIRIAILASLGLVAALIIFEGRLKIAIWSMAGVAIPIIIGQLCYLVMSFISFSSYKMEIRDIDLIIFSSGLFGLCLPFLVHVFRRLMDEI